MSLDIGFERDRSIGLGLGATFGVGQKYNHRYFLKQFLRMRKWYMPGCIILGKGRLAGNS